MIIEGGEPQVTLLLPDLRAPTVGTALRMKALLEPLAVEIVGPDFNQGVCSMYRDCGPFVVVPSKRLYRWPDFLWEARRIDAFVRGRWVVAFKAYMNTVPVALRLQKKGRARAAVFLDEKDSASLADLSRTQRIKRCFVHARHPLDAIYHPCVESMIRKADLVLAATSALQKEFGGHLVHLGIDTKRFRPFSEAEIIRTKSEIGIENFFAVGFAGVARPHKGLEALLKGICLSSRRNVILLVIGPQTEYLHSLLEDNQYGRFLFATGEVTQEDLPRYLAACDVLAVPLSDTPLARTQLPIKVFEAMAMAKPIIASAVGDLPRVLGDTAWLVPPDDPATIARALEEICSDPRRAKERGMRARARCEAEYSLPVCGRRLRRILQFEQ